MNCACLSRCQRDVRPPVQMRRVPRAFSMVSPGDSDIPSSCEIKDDPLFKPLQGNPSFFLIRASQCSFHLGQQTHDLSHIPIVEARILLRCLWKVGLPVDLKPGSQLSSQDDILCMELSSRCCAEIDVPLYLRRGLRESLELPK